MSEHKQYEPNTIGDEAVFIPEPPKFHPNEPTEKVIKAQMHAPRYILSVQVRELAIDDEGITAETRWKQISDGSYEHTQTVLDHLADRDDAMSIMTSPDGKYYIFHVKEISDEGERDATGMFDPPKTLTHSINKEMTDDLKDNTKGLRAYFKEDVNDFKKVGKDRKSLTDNIQKPIGPDL